MSIFSYHNRYFRSVRNSASGEVNSATLFHYRQHGATLWATYQGGAIRFGVLVGTVAPEGALHFSYQHLNNDGLFMTGVCHSTPELLPSGQLRLHERWQWTSGDQSHGESIVEEVAAPAAAPASFNLRLLPELLAICRLPAGSAIPEWAAQGPFCSITCSAGELSVVCPAAQVPAGVQHVSPYQAWQVQGPLDFHLTGVLAALTAPLAAAGVPIFALSTYDTDYLLVQATHLPASIVALTQAGHTVLTA
jgi:hypothetical protein